MNFATWSIRNPIPSIMLFALLAVAGMWGFYRLSIQGLPDLEVPVVTVGLTLPGAAPAQLETEVARKVEDSLATLSGLRHLRTSITNGSVSIRVEFVFEKQLSAALFETKDAVERVRSDLPADLLQPTVTAAANVGDAVLTYAISSSTLNEEQLSWFVDYALAKAVLTVPGVGRFERVGGLQREVRVEVDPGRLAALGVTAGDVSRALQQVQQESSGGRGQLDGQEQAVRTIATVRQASDLGALRISLTDGRSLRLDEVATVIDTVAERSQAALLDGKAVVGFKVYRARGFDEARLAEGTRKALAALQASEPSISLAPVSGSVNYTMEQFRGSMDMLYEGALLATLVVWLFLRDWRATVIAAAALPLSILPAFAAMAWLGFSLNTVTLLALAVIVGVLVDDAIVEVENIERHSHMGKPIKEATEDAVNEIALAVMATTMSLVVVFLPTAMMSGITGMLFKQFGWTAVIAVLASLMVARLLTPMMAVYLLKPHPRQREDGVIMRWYMICVRWCLAHRKSTLVGATVFFFGSIALIPLLEIGLIPPSDSGTTTISIELPPGRPLKSTLEVAEAARRAISDVDGITHVFTTIGNAQQVGPGLSQAGEVRRASLMLVLAPRGERRPQVEIEKTVRQMLTTVAGARFALGGSGPGSKLQLILASDNADALKASAQALERELRGISQLSNIQSTATLDRPEIIIRPDPQRAAERGVTAEAIGETVRVATSGDFDARVPHLMFDNRQVYIRARLSDAALQDIDTFANLRVRGSNGLIPLSSVATLSVEGGPNQIDRYDRRRYVTVSADLAGMSLGTARQKAQELPAVVSLPTGVQLINTGDAELLSELGTGFGVAMIVGIICVFCVLILLFKDVFLPITILSAMPLSVGGAFVAILIARSELNLPSLIGLVMLTGIVAKNSILLVDYVVMGQRDRGMSLLDALMDACHKRARPIVMTTVAMIAGMLPIAMGLGADASFRQPMAIAVIGGLITSTALSLLVVPVTFSYVDGFERWLRRGRGHILAPAK